METIKEKEITDEMLAMKEEEFFGYVESSLDPIPSEQRIDDIIRRAELETVAKDSANFVAEGVTKGLLGVLDTMMCLGTGDDPKRNY